MKYSTFAETVEAASLQSRRCTGDHWQILGGERLVNVWPHSKKGFRFQADGQKSRLSRGGGNLQQAIDLAGPSPQAAVEQALASLPPWEEDQQKPDRVGLIRWLWRWVW
jgi:hypothetical protein